MTNLIIIIVSIILSGFFSGMEIAFITSNKLRIELDKKQNPLSSKILSLFTKNPGQYITTMLIGNNIVLVIYGIVMAKILEPYLLQIITNNASLLILQTIISTLIILFFAEFLPKALFRINPNLALNIFYIPLFTFYLLFYPITKFTIGISNFLLIKIFKVKNINSPKQYTFGKVDLDNLVTLGKDETDEPIDYESEIKYVKNVLEFSEAKLRDCMIPRNELVALEIDSSIEELKEKFIETGLSKILIYKDTIDNIIGYVNIKEIFKNPNSIKSKLVKCLIAPETMRANKLLNIFMKENKSIAVIVDEFGGTSGLVTIEDIIEEILGEIEDEHDYLELTENKINNNEFLLSGRLEIDYLNEKYNLNIPESEEYDTLAGYILFHHQSFPLINEVIEIENFKFTVIKVSEAKLKIVNLVINQ